MVWMKRPSGQEAGEERGRLEASFWGIWGTSGVRLTRDFACSPHTGMSSLRSRVMVPPTSDSPGSGQSRSKEETVEVKWFLRV